jgi:hypothetical protein
MPSKACRHAQQQLKTPTSTRAEQVQLLERRPDRFAHEIVAILTLSCAAPRRQLKRKPFGLLGNGRQAFVTVCQLTRKLPVVQVLVVPMSVVLRTIQKAI